MVQALTKTEQKQIVLTKTKTEQKQIVLTKTKTVVKVTYDDDVENPRVCDNASNWLCFHNRYSLGDKHINKEFNRYNYDNWAEVKDAIMENYDVAFIVPLPLYDHTIQQVSIGEASGWDCGRIGFAFMTKEQAKEFIPDIEDYKELNKPMQDKLLSVIQAEVNTYNQWLIGDVKCIEQYDVYEDENGFVKHEELVDSCCGFYFDKDYTPEVAIKDTFGLNEGEYELEE